MKDFASLAVASGLKWNLQVPFERSADALAFADAFVADARRQQVTDLLTRDVDPDDLDAALDAADARWAVQREALAQTLSREGTKA